MATLDTNHPAFSARIINDDGTPVLIVHGEIDMATASEFESVLHAYRNSHTDCLVIDMAAVPFMDSSGLAVLLHALQQADKPLQIRRPSPQVRRLLGMTTAGILPITD